MTKASRWPNIGGNGTESAVGERLVHQFLDRQWLDVRPDPAQAEVHRKRDDGHGQRDRARTRLVPGGGQQEEEDDREREGDADADAVERRPDQQAGRTRATPSGFVARRR